MNLATNVPAHNNRLRPLPVLHTTCHLTALSGQHACRPHSFSQLSSPEPALSVFSHWRATLHSGPVCPPPEILFVQCFVSQVRAPPSTAIQNLHSCSIGRLSLLSSFVLCSLLRAPFACAHPSVQVECESNLRSLLCKKHLGVHWDKGTNPRFGDAYTLP